MQATPFQLASAMAKGNVLELIEFKVIKVSKQIPFGEGSLQNTTAVDAAGTEMTVAFMDHTPIDESWVNCWYEAVSTPGLGNQSSKLFGVQVGEYGGKKRIEVKAKAFVQMLQQQQQPAPSQASRQAAPQQRQQTQPAQPSYQEQERREQQSAQRTLPQTHPQLPPPRQAPTQQPQTTSVRTWAAKIAAVSQAAMDASVHLAFADKKRHGLCRTNEQVASLATTIFIELTRKVDWGNVQATDLELTPLPRRPLCELFNSDTNEVTDDFRPVSDGMDGNEPTGPDRF